MVQFAGGVSTLGNTAGNTGTKFGTVVLAGTNNVTLSQITGSAGVHTVQISGAAQSAQSLGVYASSQTTGQSSSSTVDARSMTLVGQGIVSVGLSAGSVLISASAGGGGAATVSRFPLDFNLTLVSSSAYTGSTTTTAGGTRTGFSLYLAPFVIPVHVTFNTVGMMMSHAAVAGTGSLTNAHMCGLYTLNAGTALSLVSSFHHQLHLSQSSVTARSHYWFWGTNSTSNSSSVGGNVSASIAKANLVVLHSSATSLASGEYWLGYMQTMRTSGAAVGSFSAWHPGSSSQSTLGSLFGTNVRVDALRFHGIVSGTISSGVANIPVMPASIHTSAITGTGGSSQNRSNLILFGSR